MFEVQYTDMHDYCRSFHFSSYKAAYKFAARKARSGECFFITCVKVEVQSCQH